MHARHAGLVAQALDKDLSARTLRARLRKPMATSRRSTHRKETIRRHGPNGSRPRAARPDGAHARARRHLAVARTSTKARGGYRMPRPRFLCAIVWGYAGDRKVLDLCAAPGGKTAQLAMAGANVTAVDRSPRRLNRLRENLNSRLPSRPRLSPPTHWNGNRKAIRRGRCSTRLVRRPAQSAVIPTCHG